MQFQQCRRKVLNSFFFTLSTLHLCTLQIFTITEIDPEHDRNRPRKSKIEKIEESPWNRNFAFKLPFGPFQTMLIRSCANEQLSGRATMNCSSISFTWQLTCVNGSDKHILLSNANSNRFYLTMYKLLPGQISFQTKKLKKRPETDTFSEVVLCV